MKFTEQQYVENMAGYFGCDEEISNEEMKLVRTRKPHECAGTDHDGDPTIPAGSMAMLEKAIHVEYGRVSCYVCMVCSDEWLKDVLDGQ